MLIDENGMIVADDCLILLFDETDENNEFVFKISNSSMRSIRQRFNSGWSKSDRAGGYPFWQATKKATSSFSIGGFYLPALVGAKPLIKGNGQKELDKIVRDQEPVSMILGDGTFYGKVVVLSAEFDKSLFLSDGTAQKVDFVLEIEEYHD